MKRRRRFDRINRTQGSPAMIPCRFFSRRIRLNSAALARSRSIAWYEISLWKSNSSALVGNRS